MLTDTELRQFNEQGLIPGPSEIEEDFRRRADFCLNFKDKLSAELPFSKGEFCTETPILKESFPLTSRLYGMVPEWVVLFFSNEKLLPWHGGAAWIFQLDDSAPTCAILQLRKAFFQKKKYFGLVERSELVAHELCHVGRMMFEEPVFEEVLAYRTSSSWLSRNLGPLIQSPGESVAFVLILMLILLTDLGILFFGTPDMLWKTFWVKLLPLGLIVYALWRLYCKKSLFDLAEKKLLALLNSQERASSVVYRLTDKEIKFFAESTPEQIQEYINRQTELRWRVIRMSYFSKD